MPTPPTFDELYEIGKAEVQSRDPRLTDFTEGSTNDAWIGGAAAIVDQAIAVDLDSWKDQYIDTAEGAALDALIADKVGTAIERSPATGSVGTLTFTRGTSTGVLPIPAGTRVSGTVDGETVQVATDSTAIIPNGVSTVDVTATAVTTGRDTNVAAGVLTTIDDTVGADPALTVTNAARFVGGDDEETDASLRSRFKRYRASLRRGTAAALETGALTVAGVRYVTVDESFAAPDDGGYTAVYVGDPDGRGNAALAAAVEAELINWRCAGAEVRVLAAEREEITLSLTVYHLPGADTTTLRADAIAAAQGYVNNLAAGVTMRESRIEAAVHAVSDDVVSVAQGAPVGDYAPTEPYYAVRVNDADISVTLSEVEA